MSTDKETKTKIIEGYARHQGDTGSPEVQIALFDSTDFSINRAFTCQQTR